MRRAAIETAVDDLLGASRPDTDLRRTLVVHPLAVGGDRPGPGIDVHRGASSGRVGPTAAAELVGSGRPGSRHERGHRRRRGPSGGARDVYSVPPVAIQEHAATGTEPSVRIVFSNAALLEPSAPTGSAGRGRRRAARARAEADDHAVRNDGRVQQLERLVAAGVRAPGRPPVGALPVAPLVLAGGEGRARPHGQPRSPVPRPAGVPSLRPGDRGPTAPPPRSSPPCASGRRTSSIRRTGTPRPP